MNGLTIPTYCGVMLLPDCTVFPHGALPLHIFEKRYRQMLNDALEGDCLFAIGNRIGEEHLPMHEQAAPIGTIGLIRASRETKDGTSNMILHGITRVRFKSWKQNHPYPCAHITPIASEKLDHEQENELKLQLHNALKKALESFDSDISTFMHEMMERTDDLHVICDVIAQQFIQEPNLRQSLLETASLLTRINIIKKYLSTF